MDRGGLTVLVGVGWRMDGMDEVDKVDGSGRDSWCWVAALNAERGGLNEEGCDGPAVVY